MSRLTLTEERKIYNQDSIFSPYAKTCGFVTHLITPAHRRAYKAQPANPAAGAAERDATKRLLIVLQLSVITTGDFYISGAASTSDHGFTYTLNTDAAQWR